MRDWPYSSRCAYSSGADFHALAMVPRERVLRHERGATNAPLRVDDGQFALGFESANLRKNRRPHRRRSAVRLLQFDKSGVPDVTVLEVRARGDRGIFKRNTLHYRPQVSIVGVVGNARRVGDTSPCRLDRRSLTLPSCAPTRLGLTQDKQLPSGAPNRRGNVGAQRMRWLSRVNPMAGSWSLAAYPRSYRPVSPGE